MTDASTPVYGSTAVMMATREGRLPDSLTATDFAVLMVVADHGGKNNRAWPAVATVARCAHCSPTAARRSIHRLAELGILVELAPATRNTGVTYSVNLPEATGLPIRQGSQSDSPTPPTMGAHPSQSDSPPLPIRQGRALNLTANSLRESLTESQMETGGESARAREGDPTPIEVVLRSWEEIAKGQYKAKPAMGGELETAYERAAEQLLKAYGGDMNQAQEAMHRCAQDGFKPTLLQIAKNPDGYAYRAPRGEKPPQPAGTRYTKAHLEWCAANDIAGAQHRIEDFGDDDPNDPPLGWAKKHQTAVTERLLEESKRKYGGAKPEIPKPLWKTEAEQDVRWEGTNDIPL